jgi:hypothetical protein
MKSTTKKWSGVGMKTRVYSIRKNGFEIEFKYLVEFT